jgi:hypothetical protein
VVVSHVDLGGIVMKVTKLKKGYRINLSDSEYDLLSNEMQWEFMHSGTFIDQDWKHLPANQQRVLTEISNMTRDWFAITENRRD